MQSSWFDSSFIQVTPYNYRRQTNQENHLYSDISEYYQTAYTSSLINRILFFFFFYCKEH